MLAQRKGVENLNGAGEGSMKHGGQDAQQLPLERTRASVRAFFLVSGGPDRNARPPVNRRRASSARSRSRKRRPTVPRTGPPPFSSLPAHNGPSNGIGGDNGRDELGSTAPDESDVAVSSGVENSMRPQSLVRRRRTDTALPERSPAAYAGRLAFDKGRKRDGV